MRVMSPRIEDPRKGRSFKIAGLWLVILLVLGTFGMAAVKTLTQPPDPYSLCRTGQTVTASTVVVVDSTDALNEIQKRRVKATVQEAARNLPRGGKFAILGINALAPGEPIEFLSDCRPIAPFEVDPKYETVSLAQKRWTETFWAPVEAAIDRAIQRPVTPASPLIETVAAVLTRPDFDARVPERHLVLVSDLLQHSKALSQLHGGKFWEAYRTSALVKETPFDLHGTAIAIDYLLRPRFARIQGEVHRSFWRRLFQEAGADEVVFVGLHAPQKPFAQAKTDKSGGKR
jgi:hypothetical protein